MIESCIVPFRLARFQHIDFTGDYDIAFQQRLKTLNANQGTSKIVKADSETIIKMQKKEKTFPREKVLHLKLKRMEVL